VQQIYTIWKDSNGTLVMLGADGKPVAAGTVAQVLASLIKADRLPSDGGFVQINRQTPVDPVVPRPHAVSGAAG